MSMEKILIIGSQGQIGLELSEVLRNNYGHDNVVCADVKEVENPVGPYEKLDAMDRQGMYEVIKKHGISQVYLLAALLSATAEQKPKLAWDLNMEGLFNVLDAAKEGMI